MLFVGSLYVALISVKEEVHKKASQLYAFIKERIQDMSQSQAEFNQAITNFRRSHGSSSSSMSGEDYNAVNASLLKILYEATSNTLVSVN